jgi:hypothetical protein
MGLSLLRQKYRLATVTEEVRFLFVDFFCRNLVSGLH